jgi:AraC-like DNA-binding protein
MEETQNINVRSDPSGIQQHFSAINIKIHCCRYWKLAEWELNNLSFPFWRLYYNSLPGAEIVFSDNCYSLQSDQLFLIPPYTSFSTQLKKRAGERLNGSRMTSEDQLYHLKAQGMVDHLFIHFNLGFQADQLNPGIYQLKTNTGIQQMLDKIKQATVRDNSWFGQSTTLLLYELIIQMVNQIPTERWKNTKFDYRVMKVIDYIEKHFNEKISNDSLAHTTAMATNSLLRLFKQNTGITLQQFIQQKRIEKAVMLMHHQQASIEQIAENCGFSDRHHFSKVFKRTTGISPAAYRSLHGANEG